MKEEEEEVASIASHSKAKAPWGRAGRPPALGPAAACSGHTNRGSGQQGASLSRLDRWLGHSESRAQKREEAQITL